MLPPAGTATPPSACISPISATTIAVAVAHRLRRRRATAGREHSHHRFQIVPYRYPDGPDDHGRFAVLPDGDVTIVSKGRRADRILPSPPRRHRPRGCFGRGAVGGIRGRQRRPAGRRNWTPGKRRRPLARWDDPRRQDLLRGVLFFRREDRDVVNWRGPGKPCFLGDAESQGEAITYIDRDTLLLTSERGRGAAGLIHRVRC